MCSNIVYKGLLRALTGDVTRVPTQSWKVWEKCLPSSLEKSGKYFFGFFNVEKEYNFPDLIF